MIVVRRIEKPIKEFLILCIGLFLDKSSFWEAPFVKRLIHQEINRLSSNNSRCLNAIFPWRSWSAKNLLQSNPKKKRTNTNLLIWVEFTICLNGALPPRKCSINSRTKFKTSIYVFLDRDLPYEVSKQFGPHNCLKPWKKNYENLYLPVHYWRNSQECFCAHFYQGLEVLYRWCNIALWYPLCCKEAYPFCLHSSLQPSFGPWHPPYCQVVFHCPQPQNHSNQPEISEL